MEVPRERRAAEGKPIGASTMMSAPPVLGRLPERILHGCAARNCNQRRRGTLKRWIKLRRPEKPDDRSCMAAAIRCVPRTLILAQAASSAAKPLYPSASKTDPRLRGDKRDWRG
jgi:hypothetical protein